MNSYCPICAAIAADLIAQFLKPFFYFMYEKKWDWSLVASSGGFPSSHSAMVSGLAIVLGMENGFDSPVFAISFVLCAIVIYDAANVRYYAGQNIQITQQLIQDIQELTQIKLDDPIYTQKIKKVLGHRWIEVIGGIVLGVIIGALLELAW